MVISRDPNAVQMFVWEQHQKIKILFGWKLRADWSQGMLDNL
jgi:hypothetical protein